MKFIKILLIIFFTVFYSKLALAEDDYYIGVMINSGHNEYKIGGTNTAGATDNHDREWQQDFDYRINLGKNYKIYNVNLAT